MIAGNLLDADMFAQYGSPMTVLGTACKPTRLRRTFTLLAFGGEPGHQLITVILRPIRTLGLMLHIEALDQLSEGVTSLKSDATP